MLMKMGLSPKKRKTSTKSLRLRAFARNWGKDPGTKWPNTVFVDQFYSDFTLDKCIFGLDLDSCLTAKMNDCGNNSQELVFVDDNQGLSRFLSQFLCQQKCNCPI
jgi:hypothetical protein